MDIDFLSFDKFFRDRLTNSADYLEAISTCIGIGVSRILPIPSTELENPEYHWDANIRYQAVALIHMFHSNVPIDPEMAESVARSFWMVRHSCAYPSTYINADTNSQSSFIGNYVSVNNYIDENMQKRLNKNIGVFALLSSRVGDLISLKQATLYSQK